MAIGSVVKKSEIGYMEGDIVVGDVVRWIVVRHGTRCDGR